MTSVHNLIEVELVQSDDFFRVKETLMRIGIASYGFSRKFHVDKKLVQSCHILHKKGKYYIGHFKEIHALDGKTTDFTIADMARRNQICNLLQEWGLVKIVSGKTPVLQSVSQRTTIIHHSEKENWNLIQRYSDMKIENKTKTTRTFNPSVSIGHKSYAGPVGQRKAA